MFNDFNSPVRFFKDFRDLNYANKFEIALIKSFIAKDSGISSWTKSYIKLYDVRSRTTITVIRYFITITWHWEMYRFVRKFYEEYF